MYSSYQHGKPSLREAEEECMGASKRSNSTWGEGVQCLWPGFQTQESKEDVDEEGSGEEDVDSEEFDENDGETELLGREGESQEHEEGTADVDIY